MKLPDPVTTVEVNGIVASVTDANNRPCGTRAIRVTFVDGSPSAVLDGERDYLATGRRGTNVQSGNEVVEFRTGKDERIWITLDGRDLWED